MHGQYLVRSLWSVALSEYGAPKCAKELVQLMHIGRHACAQQRSLTCKAVASTVDSRRWNSSGVIRLAQGAQAAAADLISSVNSAEAELSRRGQLSRPSNTHSVTACKDICIHQRISLTQSLVSPAGCTLVAASGSEPLQATPCGFPLFILPGDLYPGQYLFRAR